jgi:hypothetical protein
MKTIILASLIIIGAASAPAATYTSEWSVFDSGMATTQSGAVAHTGILGAWAAPFLPAAATTPSAPVLSIVLVGGNVRVSWPVSVVGFELEERPDVDGGIWTTIAGPYQSDATEQFILAPATQSSRFYRLRSQ